MNVSVFLNSAEERQHMILKIYLVVND